MIDKEIEEVLPPEEIDGEFEAEVYLSTDGKNTVKIKATDRAGRKAGLEWAKRVYEAMQGKWGTKQELNKKVYQANKPMQEEMACPNCGSTEYKLLQVKKAGKNQGKWFYSCKDCEHFEWK